MKKRILSLVLALTMVLGLVSGVTAFAESGTCGENLTWTLDGYGVLTISGTGDMTSAPWQLLGTPFPPGHMIKEVHISEGVTSIAEEAFYHCINLTSIIIPDSVTSIGKDAFQYCSLKSVKIPHNVDNIDGNVFSNCSDLESINVSENNPYYLSFEGVLFDKDRTTLVAYANGKQESSYVIPDGVKNIGSCAFISCKKLTGITMPDSVLSVGNYAFSGCEGLLDITIPNNMVSIGRNAFGDCNSLREITIPDSVTSIGEGAFNSCYSLKDIAIGSGVKNIGSNAFFACSGLKNITVSEANPYYSSKDCVLYNKEQTTLFMCPANSWYGTYTVPDGVISIGEQAFYYCDFKSVTIPDSVISISKDAFTDCFIRDINVSDNNPNYSSKDGVLFNKEKTVLIRCPGTKTDAYIVPYGVTHIEDWAFYDTDFRNIILPDGVKSIGVGTFAESDDYLSIIIPDSVTSIDESAFFSTLEREKDIYYGGTAEQWNALNVDLQDCVSVHFNSIVKVTVDGDRVLFDQPPIIENDRTLVPLRAIFEELGAEVSWDGATETVTATKDNTTISLTIGSDKMTVNNSVKTLDVPAKIVNSRTLVPVRAISEAFGYRVGWDGSTKTVKINTKMIDHTN